MKQISVLIIDDSVITRKVLSDVVASDSTLTVAGVAANGKIGLSKIEQLQPDVILLDVLMPEMDGLETLKEMIKRDIKIPVIMYSAVTEKSAAITIDALFFGACDYVTKPTNLASIEEVKKNILVELIPKIKSCFENNNYKADVTNGIHQPIVQPISRKTTGVIKNKVDIIAIGSSTGGPNALYDLLKNVNSDLPIPIVIVQHMPANYTKLLAERLNDKQKLPIAEAVNGMEILPGHVYIAAGDYHLEVIYVNNKYILRVFKAPLEQSCRPSVNILFRSVAKLFGQRALGVILTGMGEDGLDGTIAMTEKGSNILVQDEATCVVWGMPKAIVENNLADKILPIQDMGAEINRIAQIGRFKS